ITVCGVAQEAAHRAGDRVAEASAWTSLGIALRETGRSEEAIVAHTRARDLFQAAGDRHREAMAWNNLGFALGEAGRVREAVDAHTRARTLYQAVGDRHGEARALGNLGLVLGEGRAEEAIGMHTQARDLFQAVGDRHGEAMAWGNLGTALRETDRVEEAVEAYAKALKGYREFEDWYRAGGTLYNLAIAHLHAARPAEARICYLQSADAYSRANAPTEAAKARTWAEQITP
ncbi:tetratricopeptide repeat protein, partial [Streptomyces sp. MBT53]